MAHLRSNIELAEALEVAAEWLTDKQIITDCRDAADRLRLREKPKRVKRWLTCEVCRKKFIGYWKYTCSDKCRQKLHRKVE